MKASTNTYFSTREKGEKGKERGREEEKIEEW